MIASAAAVAALVFVASGCGGSPSKEVPGGRPNVVVVMTDDQDVASLAVMRTVERRLAANGVTFARNFVTTPECCPSRATFLTGQYSHNHGVLSDFPPHGGYRAFKGADNTLPVWLQRAGYRTGFVGKYLNGYGIPDFGGGHYPGAKREIPPGWDQWYVPTNHTIYRMYGYLLNANGRLVQYGTRPRDYQTDVLAGRATRFIRRSATGREPFFLTVAPLAPHLEDTKPSHFSGPTELGRNPRPAPRDLGAFQNRRLPRPPSFNEPDVSDKPPAVRAKRPLDAAAVARLTDNYRGRLESLLAVDDMVARLLKALRAEGELQDTVFMFTSDNGFLLGQHRLTGKALPYEESARVPLVIRGPGFPKSVVRHQLVANIDLAPTIVRLTGADAGREMDGISLLPLARNPHVARHRDLLLEYLASKRRYTAIRTNRYMLARYARGGTELYDLSADPFELSNRAHDPALATTRARLERRLDELRDCAGAACR